MKKINISDERLNTIINESVRKVLSEVNWQITDPNILNAIEDETIKSKLQNGSYNGNVNNLTKTLTGAGINVMQIQAAMNNGGIQSGNYDSGIGVDGFITQSGFTAGNSNAQKRRVDRFYDKNSADINAQMHQQTQQQVQQQLQQVQQQLQVSQNNATQIQKLNSMVSGLNRRIAFLEKSYQQLQQKMIQSSSATLGNSQTTNPLMGAQTTVKPQATNQTGVK